MRDLGGRLLAIRLDLAKHYLEALATPVASSWEAAFDAHQQHRLSAPQSMALIHPHWWSQPPRPAVRGARLFAHLGYPDGGSCDAHRVWGYECTWYGHDDLHHDHLFPYSLGGPTIAANRVTLCRIHNEQKGADIHLYPWEDGLPTWFDDYLNRLRLSLG